MNNAANRLIEIHRTLANLTSSPYSHDVIELALATATSLPLHGKEHPAPVWLLIAGAPSSGKTEAVLSLKGASNVYYLDSMTENSFASGYVDSKTGERPKQLLPELDGKCLIIKDLTTIFSMREDKVKKILGDLQSIYDGEYIKATGTLGVTPYKSTFSTVACVTPHALRKHHNYMSMIGGRFLVIRLLPLTNEERHAGFECAWNETARRENVPKLRQLLVEHVQSLLREPVALEPEGQEEREELNRLALLLARGRGVIITDRVQDLNEETGEERYSYEISDVQIEEPYRALEQLRTLGRSLTRIHGRSKITDHELELLRRVVLSSISPMRGEMLGQFRKNPAGLTSKVLAGELGRSETGAYRLLRELMALQLVTENRAATGWTYQPVPELAQLVTNNVQALNHESDVLLRAAHSQNSPHTNSLITLDHATSVGGFV